MFAPQFILIGPIDLVRKRLQTPYPAYRTKLRPDTSLNQAFRDLVAKHVNVLLIPNLPIPSKHTHPVPKEQDLEKKEHPHITASTTCEITLDHAGLCARASLFVLEDVPDILSGPLVRLVVFKRLGLSRKIVFSLFGSSRRYHSVDEKIHAG
jgi:hypothetical protein